MNTVITVQTRFNVIEPLACIVPTSFQLQWERNNTRQISFTAYDDQSIAYQLLDNESIITFDGQQYVIKQCNPIHANGLSTVAVTATHISAECRRHFNRAVNNGVKSYTPNDILKFYFDNTGIRDEGYSYKVVGDFRERQISELGNSSVQEALSKVVSTWPDCTFYADNKQLTIYSADSWSKNLGNRLGYRHNSDNVSLTTDSTNIVNKVTVQGAKKEDGSWYFEPFECIDQVSVAKWGLIDSGTRQDERFRDRQAADWWGKSQLSPEPAVSITLSATDNDQPIPGEVKRLEILEKDFVTNVEVVGFTYSPLDPNSKPSITLNNSQMSILNYQRNRDTGRQNAKDNSAAISTAINDLKSIQSVGSGWLKYQKGG